MKNLFKNFKLSAFGILFIILCLVAFATWFVPSGEYIYQCSNGEAYIYENSEGKDAAVCPISEEELNSFIDPEYDYFEAEVVSRGEMDRIVLAKILCSNEMSDDPEVFHCVQFVWLP